MIVLVFLNTVTVASEHYNQPLWLEEFQGKQTMLDSFFFADFSHTLCDTHRVTHSASNLEAAEVPSSNDELNKI